MFHVSTMLPFNKDDCQQVRNEFGGFEVKHKAIQLNAQLNEIQLAVGTPYWRMQIILEGATDWNDQLS